MLRTLFTSSAGLRGHQSLLDVVGNNLANANTTAFKGQRLRFGTQFSQTLQSATAPTGGLGGTNALQVGNGAITEAIDGDFRQGSLENTGNPLDMAIQGNGFFVLGNGQESFFTRAGGFSIDSENRVIDAASGLRLQRVGTIGEPDVNDPDSPSFQDSGDNSIQIEFGKTIQGRTTTEVTFRGNLDANAQSPVREIVRINTPLTSNGARATSSTLLEDLDQTTAPYSGPQNEWQRLRLVGTAPTAGTVTLSFNGASATVAFNATAAAVQAALQGLATVGAGNVLVTGTNLAAGDLSLQFTAGLGNQNVGQVTTTASTLNQGQIVGETVREGQATRDEINISGTNVDGEEVEGTFFATSGTGINELQTLSGTTGALVTDLITLAHDGQTIGQFNGTTTTAQLQTAFDTFFGAGNVLVGGAATIGAGNVTFTFQNALANLNVDPITISADNTATAGVSPVMATSTQGRTSAVTVGDLISTINAVFGSNSAAAPGNETRGATATIDNGFITLTSDQAGHASLSLNLANSDTTTQSGNTNFNNFVVVTEGRDGATATTAIEVFDDQGTSHSLTFTFQMRENNVWDLVSAVDPTGTFTNFVNEDGEFVRLDNSIRGITFNEDGSFQAVTGTDTTEVLATTSPMTITDTVNGLSTRVVNLADNLADTNLDQKTLGTLTAGDQILIRGTNLDGSVVNTTFTYTGVAGGQTFADLITGINAAFSSTLPNGNPNPDGATATLQNGIIVLTANSTGRAELSLELTTSAAANGQIDFGSFGVVTEGADGDDSIDVEMNVLSSFQTTQNIRFSFGTVSGFDGLTQFGGFTSASAVNQDGFSPGSLTDVGVDQNGIINGVFSNGQTRQLAQVALATFANNEGLQRIGENLFREGINSGQAIVGTAGTGGAGTIQGSVLEASNVDITLEFTRLITAQRGFQVNARSFTTADQVLQETVNLKQ